MIDASKINAWFQGSPNLVWLAGNGCDCLYGNPALQRLTGLDSNQIYQLDWRYLLLEEDRAVATACWQRSVAAGTPYHSRVRIRKRNGAGVPVDLQAFRHRANDEAEIWLFSGLRLQSATREQPLEWQMQATLNLVPAHTWYTVPSGGLTFVNGWCADYLGLPAGSPLRSGIHTQAPWDSHIPLLHPDDREETRRVWANCLATGCAGEVTFRVRNAESQYRWFLSRAEPFRASDGAVLYWIGINLDIEDLKQAEFYLAEGQRLAHTGTWTFNSSGFGYWSSELFKIHGLEASGNAPHLEEYLRLVHVEDREYVEREIQKMFVNHSEFDFTKRIVKPDGNVRYVRCVGIPSRETISQSFVGTGIDVTEQKQLTEELQRREAYLAEAQRVSHTGSFGWNVSNDEHFWSEETFRIFEFPPSSRLSLQMVLNCIHPHDMPTVNLAIAAANRAEGINLEFRLVMLDGRIKYLRVVGNPRKDEGGDVEVIGAVMDITAQKLSEVDLRRNKAHLADAQRLSRTGCVGMDGNTKRVFWSEEAARIYGYPPETEPTPDLILQRSHPDDVYLVREALESAAEGRSYFDYEHRLLMPDGSIKHLHDLAHRVRDDAGNEEIIGAIMDITESKIAEARARRQEAELRQMLDLVPQLVAVFGVDRERRYANQAALKYLGMDLEDWRGGALGDEVHADDVERLRACWDSASTNGANADVEVRVRRHDGGYRWHLAQLTPVHDDRGRITGWHLACTDIEDCKRDEERLRQENLALREEIDETSMYEEIIGKSSALATVLTRISKVATSDSTVLISGETGTGKELMARAIHRRSNRSSRPFVSVNCAAIPRELILSELFGHEKGAFTGAIQTRIGRFELADGGTIFLRRSGRTCARYSGCIASSAAGAGV
jgi:PAS domain S-box-containing protein